MSRPIVQTQLYFWLLHHKITEVFDLYLATGNSALVANMAIVVYAQKRVWTKFCLEDPTGKYFKLELFDEVLARVIGQKAAGFPPVSWQQNMLVKFCLHCFASSQNPMGSLNIQTLIIEIGTQLLSLRTQLLDFVQDDDTAESANMPNTVAQFTNLGTFMSAVAADASKRPAYPLNEHDL